MEDKDGYMEIQPRWNTYQDARQKQYQEPAKGRRCKVLLGVLLTASLLLNVALTALIIIEKIVVTRDVKEPVGRAVPATLDPIAISAPDLQSSCPKNQACSCDLIPGSPKAYVVLDQETANPRIDVSSDGKTAAWGATRKSLPDNPERFEPRVWVLGREGFLSGKHCWEVEVKGDGEWCVGVAKQSVQRKGLTDFSTEAGIWGIGEYWGLRNFKAFTAPHTKLDLAKKPRRIRVLLDYEQEQVEFFDAETKVSIFLFSSCSFGGEKIYPWLRVWDGTTLVLHP